MNVKYIGLDKIRTIGDFSGRLVQDKESKKYYLQNIEYKDFGKVNITYAELKVHEVGKTLLIELNV